jgi:ribonuclease HI
MFDKFLKEIKIFRDNIFLDSLKQYLNTYSEELRSRNCEVICFCDGASSKCPKNFSIFLGAGAAILIFPKKLHGNEKLSLSYEGYIFKNEPTFKLNVVTQNNVIIATILCCFNPNTTNQKMEVGIFIEVLNELKKP